MVCTRVHNRWRPIILLRRALPLEELEGFVLRVTELERRHSNNEVVRGQRCTYIYMHTCIHAYMHTCIHIHIHICTYIYTCTYIHLDSARVRALSSPYTCIYLLHTHTHTQTWRVPHGAISRCGVITAKLHLGLVLGGEEGELPLELRRCVRAPYTKRHV